MRIGNMKIKGFMEMFVTDWKTGIKKRIYARENTISVEFFDVMGQLMVGNYNYSKTGGGGLFTLNNDPPAVSENGICFKDTTLPAPTSINFLTTSQYRSMKTTYSTSGTDKLIGTGLWDAATEVYVTAPVWGHIWTPTGSSDFYPMIPFATNPSFVPQTVLAANTITIVWTITFNNI